MLAKEFLLSLDRRVGIRNRLRGLPSTGFDVRGEKALDWGWCLANLPRRCSNDSPRLRVLDIGCCQSPIASVATAFGHEVVGIDTESLPYELPRLTFYQADLLGMDLPDASFDVAVLCSVVEHIGLAGRYTQRDVPDGDLLAMAQVARILKPDGRLLLTVPVGKDLVFRPWHRIYGEERLPLLLAEFQVGRSQYWVKQPGGMWRATERMEALQVDRQGLSYGLGQFVLKLESKGGQPSRFGRLPIGMPRRSVVACTSRVSRCAVGEIQHERQEKVG